MRRFYFERTEDVHDYSGIGRVVEGVQFSDGRVVLRWMTDKPRSTTLWDSIREAIDCHGHDGKTRLVWIDGWETEAMSFQEEAA